MIPKKYVFQGTDYKEKPYKVDWKAFCAFHLESKNVRFLRKIILLFCGMKKIGYARVSTRDQNLEMQCNALQKAGCEKIYMEKKTGRNIDRPELKKLLGELTAGDALIVWKIDRLGRSTRDICEVIEILRNKCAVIISLTEGINTATMMGEVFCKIASIFAELEISTRSERTIEGINNARMKGKKLGRPSGVTVSTDTLEAVKRMKESGVTAEHIATHFGKSKSSIYRYLKLK